MFTSILLPLVTSLAALGTIRSIDDYYPLRSKLAGGYNWEVWTLQFDALFAAYNVNWIRFIFNPSVDLYHETYAFLGNFTLYGATIAFIYFLIKRGKKQLLNTYFGNPKGLFVLGILCSGVISLIIAIGETPKFFNDSIQMINFLNPLLYLRLWTDEVTHFRCLGRFGWVFFWVFNFFMVYVVDVYLKRHP